MLDPSFVQSCTKKEMLMPRPKTFDRDQAVDDSMNEIWRRGYEASSVKALSEMLGITRSSFYNAFDSREALFKEALETYAANAPDVILNQEPGERSIRSIFTQLFRDVCHARAADAEARGCLAVNSIAELVGVEPKVGELLVKAVKAKLKRIEKLLALAVAGGEISDDGNLKGKALAIMNLLAGINLMSKVVRNEQELYL